MRYKGSKPPPLRPDLTPHDGKSIPDVGTHVLVQHRMGTVKEYTASELAGWRESPWLWGRPGGMDIIGYCAIVAVPRLSLSHPASEQGL